MPYPPKRSLPLLALVALLAHASSAEVHLVPGDFPTIQLAIDAASSGDQVLVASGVYQESLDFLGKNITVESQHGAEATIIDASGMNSVVVFAAGEGPAAKIRGFTLRNCHPPFAPPCWGSGGGICVMGGAAPTIEENVIVDNFASSSGGCIAVDGGGNPLIRRNVIARCTSDNGGGGVYLRSTTTDALIERNVIVDNVALWRGGGIELRGGGRVDSNVIRGNAATRGAGIAAGGDAVLIGNLIVGNRGSVGAGVAWSVGSSGIPPLLVQNTIADNDGVVGSGIYSSTFDAPAVLHNNIIAAPYGQVAVECDPSAPGEPPELHFSNVFSPTGNAFGTNCFDATGTGGNISEDPLFVAPSSGDYRLRVDSPSVDAGSNDAPEIPASDIAGRSRILDGDGDRVANVDMGAFETELRVCDVALSFSAGTLDIHFELATPDPAAFSAWLFAAGGYVTLGTVSLPVLDTITPVDVPLPNFPNVGTVVVVTSLATQGAGLTCFATGIADTGSQSSATGAAR